jgi:hypothetical protein
MPFAPVVIPASPLGAAPGFLRFVTPHVTKTLINVTKLQIMF